VPVRSLRPEAALLALPSAPSPGEEAAPGFAAVLADERAGTSPGSRGNAVAPGGGDGHRPPPPDAVGAGAAREGSRAAREEHPPSRVEAPAAHDGAAALAAASAMLAPNPSAVHNPGARGEVRAATVGRLELSRRARGIGDAPTPGPRVQAEGIVVPRSAASRAAPSSAGVAGEPAPPTEAPARGEPVRDRPSPPAVVAAELGVKPRSEPSALPSLQRPSVAQARSALGEPISGGGMDVAPAVQSPRPPVQARVGRGVEQPAAPPAAVAHADPPAHGGEAVTAPPVDLAAVSSSWEPVSTEVDPGGFAVAAEALGPPVPPAAIPGLIDGLRRSASPGVASVVVALSPPELGRMRVQVTQSATGTVVRIAVERTETAHLIEQALGGMGERRDPGGGGREPGSGPGEHFVPRAEVRSAPSGVRARRGVSVDTWI
jgi:hypothetical protein